VSQQRTVAAAGQRAPFGTVSIKRPCAVVVAARSGTAGQLFSQQLKDLFDHP